MLLLLLGLLVLAALLQWPAAMVLLPLACLSCAACWTSLDLAGAEGGFNFSCGMDFVRGIETTGNSGISSLSPVNNIEVKHYFEFHIEHSRISG